MINKVEKEVPQEDGEIRRFAYLFGLIWRGLVSTCVAGYKAVFCPCKWRIKRVLGVYKRGRRHYPRGNI